MTVDKPVSHSGKGCLRLRPKSGSAKRLDASEKELEDELQMKPQVQLGALSIFDWATIAMAAMTHGTCCSQLVHCVISLYQ